MNKSNAAFCAQCARDERDDKGGKPTSARGGTNPVFAPWLVKKACEQDRPDGQAGVFEVSKTT